MVDPLGLVAKGGAWYLVAAIDGDIRDYRISRVIEAEMTDQSFIRPENFDLVAHWRQSAVEFKSKLPRYPVTVRVHPETVNKMYIIGGFSRVESVDPPDEAIKKDGGAFRSAFSLKMTPANACWGSAIGLKYWSRGNYGRNSLIARRVWSNSILGGRQTLSHE